MKMQADQFLLLLLLSAALALFGSTGADSYYELRMDQNERFVLGDDYPDANDDDDDAAAAVFGPDDEMIRPTDVRDYDLRSDEPAFDRLHRLVRRHGYLAPATTVAGATAAPRPHYDYDGDYDDVDVENDGNANRTKRRIETAVRTGGIVTSNRNAYVIRDKLGYIRTDFDVFRSDNKVRESYDQLIRHVRTKRVKRDGDDGDESGDGYDRLAVEYRDELRRDERRNETFAYGTRQGEGGGYLRNAFGILGTLPPNCTAAELGGFGPSAVRCAWSDLKGSDTFRERWQLLKRLRRMLLIWAAVYLSVVVPCWCQRGWCCCCCRCRCCFPLATIDRAKKFLADNPPGTFGTRDGKTVEYEPTAYESDAYARLERALMRL